uniref:Uncharacterized protein n=1 Tax=Arundo donax TaxID=35708 RepID=A0A0A9FN10_ARUDO
MVLVTMAWRAYFTYSRLCSRKATVSQTPWTKCIRLLEILASTIKRFMHV